MFIPNEQLFGAIVELEPDLLGEALRKGVVMTSPTTLFAVLATVREVVETLRQPRQPRDPGLPAGFRAAWGEYLTQRQRLGRRLKESLREFHALSGARRQKLDVLLTRVDGMLAPAATEGVPAPNGRAPTVRPDGSAPASCEVLAREVEPVRETDIRQPHKLVLGRSSPGEAGRYRQHTRIIAGSRVRLPGLAEVPAPMGDLARWLSEAPAGHDTAFEAHRRLVAVHPFSGGNGRTARLLMNLLLIRSGYPPVVVGREHRPDYIDALELRSLEGDPDPYRHLMAERLDAGSTTT
jgi:hypothetical protein